LDVLLVHIASVTKEVLEMRKELKIIGYAQGGSANVDIDAAKMLASRYHILL